MKETNDIESDLVSVIIPTYFSGDDLIQAIQSARNQSYSNIEIIVVDDSGEGYAQDIVSSFEDVEYIRLSENKGANRARTEGYNLSNGKFIQFLDDDDILKRQKIEKQVEVISSKYEVVYCGVKTSRGVDFPDKKGEVIKYALGFSMWPCMTSSMLITSQALSEVMPLSNRPGADDLGLMIELADQTLFNFVEDILVIKGESENSRGKSMGAVRGRKDIIEEYDELYKQYPANVRNTALSESYRLEGEKLINENLWSLSSIQSFYKEFYYSREFKSFGRFIASMFGLPGICVSKYTYEFLKTIIYALLRQSRKVEQSEN